MTPDSELLREFARTHSEAAFAELVRRHVNLVYSAALRQVNGDEHSAKDVAQTVFADLARKAGSLSHRESLTGWLYTSAHFAAAKFVRGENRRRDREEKFMREPNETAPDASRAEAFAEAGADWEKLRPTLDDAMHELKETDREAILLRYFENQPFIQVGAKLGLNENAARMRVERALEKLRDIFTKRGITTATALASVISANAVQMAPANMAATVTTASIAAAGTGTFTLLKIMTATKLKLAFGAIVVAGAATAFVLQQQNQTQLRGENESLRQQIAQLQTDNESLSNRLAEAGDFALLSDKQMNELLKLRGEVGLMRRQIEVQKTQTNRPVVSSREANYAGHTPGAYISKDQLRFAGYATPEAALETITWAMMAGTYEQVTQGFPPELLAEESKNSKAREDFETQQKMMAPLFKGLQIIAEKSLAGDKVELKVKMDTDPIPSQTRQQPPFLIQPMVKIENEWKLGGSTRDYQNGWENGSQVQVFVP
jgi:RNA polymerase sigma factor (sigma-70 family)